MEQKPTCGCRIPDSPHMRLVCIFLRIMRRHHAHVERCIGALGIHHGQHRMLMHLARHEGELPSQKELAEIMGVSPAAVTTTLKRLEKEGYISRPSTTLAAPSSVRRISLRRLSSSVMVREM